MVWEDCVLLDGNCMKIVRKYRAQGVWEAYVYQKLRNNQVLWNCFYPSSQEAEPGLSLSLRLLWCTYTASCKAMISIGLDIVYKENQMNKQTKKPQKDNAYSEG